MGPIFLIITFKDMAANFLRKTFLVCKANPTSRKLEDLHLTEALKITNLIFFFFFFQNKTSKEMEVRGLQSGAKLSKLFPSV